MAINSIQFLISPSVTATNGSDVITVTGSVDCSSVYSGTAILVNGYQVVEAISGTVPDGSGNSTITLRFPWSQATVTSDMVAFNTIEGLSEAIRRSREIIANLDGADATIQQQLADINANLVLIGDAPTYAIQTAQDALDTAADVLLTNADAAATAADVLLTNADVVTTNANVVITNADVVTTNTDAAQTAQDSIDTNADKLVTNADAVQTAADRVQTGLDASATAADRVQTGLDATATAADVVITNADVITTNDAKNISLANANYAGYWSDQVGSKSPPFAVREGNTIYMLDKTVVVESSQPSLNPADWFVLGVIGSDAPNALKLGGETAAAWDAKIDANVPQTRTVAGKALTTNITLDTADINGLQAALDSVTKTMDQPTNVSPANGITDVSLPAILTSSPATGDDLHVNSIWTVYSDAGGITEVYNSGVVSDLTSHTVANNALNGEVQYWFSVQYIGVSSLSTPSSLTSFTAISGFSSLFDTTLYTGTGASQDIISGLDFVTNDGLVWIKPREEVQSHFLHDTVRGIPNALRTNTTDAEQNNLPGMFNSFNTDGFTVGVNGGSWNSILNGSGFDYVAWQFIKAQGFFDIVQYVGDGIAGRTVPLDLVGGSSEFGMAIVKSTDATSFWYVQHRSLGGTKYLQLNDTGAVATNNGAWNDVSASTTELTLGISSNVNLNTGSYVAYAFAHNPSKGIFCGSYTGTGAAGNKVTTGFPVGWLLVKNANAVNNWEIFDIARDPTNPNGNLIEANTSNAEQTFAGSFNLLIDGFDFTGAGRNSASQDYIFMAIADPAQF